MHISYISNSTIPSETANSVHVMKMCNALRNLGNDVDLFVPDHKKEFSDVKDNYFSAYGIKENFRVNKMPWVKFKGKGMYFSWKSAKRVKKIKSDLVLSRDIHSCFFLSFLGVFFLYESHSPIRDQGAIAEYIFRKVIKSKKFFGLVVITKSLKKYYEKVYPCLVGKIIVAPDSADPVMSEGEEEKLFVESNFSVGYTGHLYPGKGMEVIYKLAPLCPWADFHIVGGTDKDIRYWKHKCREIKNLHFHGYINHSKVSSYIKSFDAVLLPNQEKVLSHSGVRDIGSWTSPLKAFEYMAAKKAIIASDIEVLKEIFEDNYNCLLCDPENIDEWALSLRYLYENQGEKRRLEATAQEVFYRYYTWEIRANNILHEVRCFFDNNNCSEKVTK